MDNEQLDQFRKHVSKVSGQIHSCAAFSALVTSSYLDGKDWQVMLQVGIAVMQNKPIVLLVDSSVELPAKLERVADKIIWCDVAKKSSMEKASRIMGEWIRDKVKTDDT